MTSFKNFRNRTRDLRVDSDQQRSGQAEQSADGPVNRRDQPPSSATELGPQHFEILRQIESEGEPLSLAERGLM